MKIVLFSFLVVLGASQLHAQKSFQEYASKGNTSLAQNNYKEALDNFLLAIEIGTPDTSDLQWYCSLAGICAQELGKEEQAVKYYMMSLDLRTTDTDIIDRLTALCIKRKENKILEKVYVTCKERFPDKLSKYNLKLLYFYYNNKQYQKANTIADEILVYKPGYAKTLYMKAMSLVGMNKNEEAKKIFLNVLKSSPAHNKSYKQLGLLYYREATTIFDSSVKKYNKIKNPDRVDYSNFRKEKAKSWEAYTIAVKYLELSSKLEPSKQVNQALYNAYVRLEKQEMAKKYK